MGYLYLTLALFAGVAKGFCGKTVSRDMDNFKECIFINMIRMFFCALVGFIPAIIEVGFHGLPISLASMPIYLLASISMSTFCIAWMFAYRNEAYMFLSIFTMLGTVITCILDAVIYHTVISFSQWIGIAVILVAVYIMSVYNKGIKGHLSPKGLFILIIGTLGSALADFSQKMYVKQIGQSAKTFNLYMYLFAFLIILLLFILLHYKKGEPKISAKLYDPKHIGIYLAISVFLYINSVTKTMAASFLSSAQIYPVLQGANLILSALMAHFMFREKMNLKGLLGIVTAFIGLMILHIV